MKCQICRHGSTHKGYAPWSATAPPCSSRTYHDICDNCGEIYYDEEVTRSLLEQAEQASTRGVELDVRRYAAA